MRAWRFSSVDVRLAAVEGLAQHLVVGASSACCDRELAEVHAEVLGDRPRVAPACPSRRVRRGHGHARHPLRAERVDGDAARPARSRSRRTARSPRARSRSSPRSRAGRCAAPRRPPPPGSATAASSASTQLGAVLRPVEAREREHRRLGACLARRCCARSRGGACRAAARRRPRAGRSCRRVSASSNCGARASTRRPGRSTRLWPSNTSSSWPPTVFTNDDGGEVVHARAG